MSDKSDTPREHVNKILRTGLILGASRLELEPGKAAAIWRKGVPRELCMDSLSRERIELLLQSIMDQQQWKTLEETGKIAFLHAPDADGKNLRIRIFRNRGHIRVEAYPF